MKIIKDQTIKAARMFNGEAEVYERFERFIHIPMPWTKRMYTPINDDYGVRRPVLAIYWWRASPNALSLFIRIGWTSSAAGPHECRDGVKLGSNAADP